MDGRFFNCMYIEKNIKLSNKAGNHICMILVHHMCMNLTYMYVYATYFQNDHGLRIHTHCRNDHGLRIHTHCIF